MTLRRFFCRIMPILFLGGGAASAQIGSLSGRVADAANQQPLFAVNVMLAGTVRGAATDMAGEYVIDNIPVGIYTLEFSYMGYEDN